MIVLNVFQCLNVTALLFFCILKDKCQMAEPWTWIWVFHKTSLIRKDMRILRLGFAEPILSRTRTKKATL